MLLVALQIFTTLAFATTRHRRVGPWNIFLGRVVFNHRQGSSAVKLSVQLFFERFVSR
jgi:hypothetical protein